MLHSIDQTAARMEVEVAMQNFCDIMLNAANRHVGLNMLLLLLLLARLVNRQDVVFDVSRKSGSFGCRQCR